MKKLIFGLGLLLAMTLGGQGIVKADVTPLGPYPFTFTSNGTQSFGINGQPGCIVSVASTSTMGSGSLAIQTSAGGVTGSATGYPDIGVGTGGLTAITSAGTKLTFLTGGADTVLLVLTGSTSPNISGKLSCPSTIALLPGFSGGGGGGSAALSSPSPLPSPQQTISPAPNNGALAVTSNVQAGSFLSGYPDLTHNAYWAMSSNIPLCQGFCWSYGGNSYLMDLRQPNGANSTDLYLGFTGGNNYGDISLSWNASLNWTNIAANQGTTGGPCWNSQFAWQGQSELRLCVTNNNPDYEFDYLGRLHIAEDLYSLGTVSVPAIAATPVASPTPGDDWASESNTTGRRCEGGNNGTSPTNSCEDWNITKSAAWSVSQPIWATSSANKGQVSCTLSTQACTATATVTSGATCLSALDTTATTGTLGLLTVVSQSVSTTTLTVTFKGAAGSSGTVAADYHCW